MKNSEELEVGETRFVVTLKRLRVYHRCRLQSSTEHPFRNYSFQVKPTKESCLMSISIIIILLFTYYYEGTFSNYNLYQQYTEMRIKHVTRNLKIIYRSIEENCHSTVPRSKPNDLEK